MFKSTQRQVLVIFIQFSYTREFQSTPVGDKARSALPHMQQAVSKAKELQVHGWYMREALMVLIDSLQQ
ncbi:hypothetical protein GF406_08705 [candidate division KSB1 bacterium]|nr:hypothetical protein [candidate division KSB1 bacterium]